MSTRLPAPPPSARDPLAPPPGHDPGDLPDDDATSDESDLEDDDDTDEALRRPDSWPDDRDEPTIPEGLLDPDLEDLPALDGVGDDGVEDDVELPDPEEVPLEDDLDDLDAPDDTDVPVIPWQFEIRIDDRPVPAKVDPGRDQTVWLRPAGGADREVALQILGKLVRVIVQCVASDQEGVLLGRDVLSGRFLLRP